MKDRVILSVFGCAFLLALAAQIWPEWGRTTIALFGGSLFIAVGGYAVAYPERARIFMQEHQPYQWARDIMDAPGYSIGLWLMGVGFVIAGCIMIFSALTGQYSN